MLEKSGCNHQSAQKNPLSTKEKHWNMLSIGLYTKISGMWVVDQQNSKWWMPSIALNLNPIEYRWASFIDRISMFYPNLTLSNGDKGKLKKNFYKSIEVCGSLDNAYFDSLIRCIAIHAIVVLEGKGWDACY